ncbi:hypothetical protein DFH07DRAFT_781437 [Mycena maculata]|uniref:Uncharacterized protein n=1 Tax=Mycena maculata TaxID=230809 RepID=A0AAD7HYF1_9AGAR|nr:hypothetical protein DFH07DRAFT_781437 [Mycena maculata]
MLLPMRTVLALFNTVGLYKRTCWEVAAHMVLSDVAGEQFDPDKQLPHYDVNGGSKRKTAANSCGVLLTTILKNGIPPSGREPDTGEHMPIPVPKSPSPRGMFHLRSRCGTKNSALGRFRAGSRMPLSREQPELGLREERRLERVSRRIWDRQQVASDYAVINGDFFERTEPGSDMHGGLQESNEPLERLADRWGKEAREIGWGVAARDIATVIVSKNE